MSPGYSGERVSTVPTFVRIQRPLLGTTGSEGSPVGSLDREVADRWSDPVVQN